MASPNWFDLDYNFTENVLGQNCYAQIVLMITENHVQSNYFNVGLPCEMSTAFGINRNGSIAFLQYDDVCVYQLIKT